MLELIKCLYKLKKIGIYHRDIKPMNYLYNSNTRTGIVIDFGLAEVDP
jgi:cell division control protein 7